MVDINVANVIEEGRFGGPQNRMVIAANAIKNQTTNLLVFPTADSLVFIKKCKQCNVAFRTFPLSRITRQKLQLLRYILFSPLEVLGLAGLFLVRNIDVVHVSGGAWQFKGAIAGKATGRKVLWHLNDTSMPRAIRFIFSRLSFLADGYIFASYRSKEYYRRFVNLDKPSFIIPAPVDTGFFSPGKCDLIPDESIEWRNKIVIGTVANINPTKGIDFLIEVANAIAQHRQDCVFIIVGPVYKSQQRYYEKVLELKEEYGLNNIYFVGGHEDTRPFLEKFDIYLCTSHNESSPLSVWEAMSMGKAVISTDVGDVARHVKNGISGEIVGTGNVTEVVDRILNLAANPNLKLAYGEAAREIAVNELDVSICAERHINAYTQIMSHKK